MKIPCRDCLIFPLCNARKIDMEPKGVLVGISFLHRCEILDEYLKEGTDDGKSTYLTRGKETVEFYYGITL